MKRLMKILLILTAVIFVAGLGMSVGGMVMGAALDDAVAAGEEFPVMRTLWHAAKKSSFYYEKTGEQRIYHVGTPKEVDIRLHWDELRLEACGGTEAEIAVMNDAKEKTEVKTDADGKKLRIKSTGSEEGRIITLRYPSGYRFEKMRIQTDAGEVLIENDLTAKKLEIESGAGEVTGTGKITADEIKMELGAGSIDLALLDAGKISGECGLGSMELTLAGRETDYSYKLECGLGEISLDGESSGGIGRTKTLSDSGASRELELECAMGSIGIFFDK